MEGVFEVIFHILFQIFRFLFINIFLEIIIEIVIRGTGYCIVWCYCFGRNVDIESFEVVLMGFIFWLGVVPLCFYIAFK